MIKGVLFDKDGTLIEFKAMWHKVTELFITQLSERYHLSEIEMNSICDVLGYTVDGFKQDSIIQYLETSHIMEMIANVIKTFTDVECRVDELTAMFDQCATSEDVDIILMEGAIKTLKWLHARGCVLGVVTADTYKSAIHSLTKAQILDFFSFIGADDGKMKPKPEPQMLEMFCDLNAFSPDEVLVVGDSLGDYKFALNGQARFVGIRAEYSGLSDLEGQGIDLISELSELIDRISA